MNTRVNLLKDIVKDRLKKKVDFNENDISFFSIPYCINVFGEGIENYISNLVNISIEKICFLAFIKNRSSNSKIFDYNNSEIYELSTNGQNHIRDEFSSILSACITGINQNSKIESGITGALYDDFYSSSLSSPSIKFSTFLYSISKINNLNLNFKLFSQILSETDKNLLSINLDTNEILPFRKSLFGIENNETEKFNWSDFNNIRAVQISIHKRRLRNIREVNFIRNLKLSYDLLKVLMASARKTALKDFSPDEIKSFVKRVSEEKQSLIQYLYNESIVVENSALALKSKNFEKFVDSIRSSNLNLLQLEITNEETLNLLNSLKNVKNIIASKISLTSGSITCFINSQHEESAIYDIKNKFKLLLPKLSGKIKIYSSEITAFYLFRNN
ncbi:MAG: hypothetical protein ACRENO_00435 [Thermodesulfobacteriota bacterium]